MPAITNDQQATKLFNETIDKTVENLTPVYSREVLDPLINAIEGAPKNADGEPDLEALLLTLPNLFNKMQSKALETAIETGLTQGAMLGVAVATPVGVDLTVAQEDDPFAIPPEAQSNILALSISGVVRSDFTPKPASELANLFGQKQAVTSQLFDTLAREQKARAFRIAGVNRANLIQRAMDEIRKGLRSGTSRRDIQRKILQIFADAGVTGLPNHHLTVLMRQNMMTTFNIAKFRTSESPAVVRLFPYRQYLTVDDSSVRPEHAALHRQIFLKSDPFWLTHLPPWSWNCRCTFRDVSQSEVDRKGGTEKVVIDNGFARTRLKVEGREPGIDDDPDFAFPRDQFAGLDVIAMKHVEGKLREIVEAAFRKADPK